jgi:hypothetical protein
MKTNENSAHIRNLLISISFQTNEDSILMSSKIFSEVSFTIWLWFIKCVITLIRVTFWADEEKKRKTEFGEWFNVTKSIYLVLRKYPNFSFKLCYHLLGLKNQKVLFILTRFSELFLDVIVRSTTSDYNLLKRFKQTYVTHFLLS